MRLLPRSPRVVVPLAALIWLGGGVVAWTLTPIVPRHRVTLPGKNVLLALGPEARTVVTSGANQVKAPDNSDLTCGPIRFHDAQSGRLLGTALAETDTYDTTEASPDGRWLFVSAFAGSAFRPVLIDLASREVVRLPGAGERYGGFMGSGEFSADGRLLAYRGWSGDGVQMLLWDVASGRLRGPLPGVTYTVGLSANGRSMVGATHADGKSSIVVFDAETLAPRSTIAMRADETVQNVRISDDGAYVVASVTINEKQPIYVSFVNHYVTVRTWEVATGKECLEVPSVYSSFAIGPDGRTVITEHSDSRGHYCRWTDPATGAARDGPVVDKESAWPAGDLLSPDRQRLAVGRWKWAAGPWERMARQVGVPWPFQGSGTRADTRVYDATTGNHVGDIPGNSGERWSPDGRAMAMLDWQGGSVVSVWDVPPSWPVAAFAGGVAAWTVLIGGLTRWRLSHVK